MLGGWLVAAAITGACGDLPAPDLGSPPTTDPAVGNETSSSVDGAGTVETQIADDASPPRPEGYVADVLVGDDIGLSLLDGDEFVALEGDLGSVAAVRATDDYFGGLVVEQNDGSVMWYPGEGGEASIINGDGGRLLDVGFNDGTPEAILTGAEGTLDRVPLVTGERAVFTTLPPDRTVVDFSASTGVYALVYQDAACGGMVLLNPAGEEVDVGAPEAGDCPVPGRSFFGEVALGPEGDVYVYTEVTYRSDGVEAATQIVGRELSSRTELFRFEAGAGGEGVSTLAFDGSRVLFQRTSLSDEERAGLFIVDASKPENLEAADPMIHTIATFVRRPLAVGLADAG